MESIELFFLMYFKDSLSAHFVAARTTQMLGSSIDKLMWYVFVKLTLHTHIDINGFQIDAIYFSMLLK